MVVALLNSVKYQTRSLFHGILANAEKQISYAQRRGVFTGGKGFFFSRLRLHLKTDKQKLEGGKKKKRKERKKDNASQKETRATYERRRKKHFLSILVYSLSLSLSLSLSFFLSLYLCLCLSLSLSVRLFTLFLFICEKGENVWKLSVWTKGWAFEPRSSSNC